MRNSRTVPGELFSLGGLLSLGIRPRFVSAPWIASALVLAALGLWDTAMRGAPPDFILLGLAGYELVIGLTEEERVGS
jgi:hypothetical protein